MQDARLGGGWWRRWPVAASSGDLGLEAFRAESNRPHWPWISFGRAAAARTEPSSIRTRKAGMLGQGSDLAHVLPMVSSCSNPVSAGVARYRPCPRRQPDEWNAPPPVAARRQCWTPQVEYRSSLPQGRRDYFRRRICERRRNAWTRVCGPTFMTQRARDRAHVLGRHHRRRA